MVSMTVHRFVVENPNKSRKPITTRSFSGGRVLDAVPKSGFLRLVHTIGIVKRVIKFIRNTLQLSLLDFLSGTQPARKGTNPQRKFLYLTSLYLIKRSNSENIIEP